MFEFISKKFADIKILHEGYTADYFLNRMKTNALFPILFIQNNLFKKKSGIKKLHTVIDCTFFDRRQTQTSVYAIKSKIARKNSNLNCRNSKPNETNDM
jgi:hypothetical protein